MLGLFLLEESLMDGFQGLVRFFSSKYKYVTREAALEETLFLFHSAWRGD